jgi:phosphoglycolate phosphatase-like HAD superfamily hydrolase
LGIVDRILIFDFDGVLADSLAPMLRYAKQVCRDMGVMADPTKEDLEVLEKMEFSEFGHQLGIPGDQIQTFVKRNHQLFSEQEEAIPMMPGMQAVITGLAENNTLAIITGNSCKVVEEFLEAYQIRDKFQEIFCAEHEGNRMQKIHKVKDLVPTKTTDIYLIGDAVSDIRAARAAGIKSVAVTWGHQSRQKLSQNSPDLIVDDPEDLANYFSGYSGK